MIEYPKHMASKKEIRSKLNELVNFCNKLSEKCDDHIEICNAKEKIELLRWVLYANSKNKIEIDPFEVQIKEKS